MAKHVIDREFLSSTHKGHTRFRTLLLMHPRPTTHIRIVYPLFHKSHENEEIINKLKAIFIYNKYQIDNVHPPSHTYP